MYIVGFLYPFPFLWHSSKICYDETLITDFYPVKETFL